MLVSRTRGFQGRSPSSRRRLVQLPSTPSSQSCRPQLVFNDGEPGPPASQASQAVSESSRHVAVARSALYRVHGCSGDMLLRRADARHLIDAMGNDSRAKLQRRQARKALTVEQLEATHVLTTLDIRYPASDSMDNLLFESSPSFLLIGSRCIRAGSPVRTSILATATKSFNKEASTPLRI